VLWTTNAKLPKTSAYPLVDFTYKTKHVDTGNPVAQHDICTLANVTQAGDADIRAVVKGTKIGIRTEVEPAPLP
jgi:hypothetical protein